MTDTCQDPKVLSHAMCCKLLCLIVGNLGEEDHENLQEAWGGMRQEAWHFEGPAEETEEEGEEEMDDDLRSAPRG